jgi:hypothetical protein
MNIKIGAATLAIATTGLGLFAPLAVAQSAPAATNQTIPEKDATTSPGKLKAEQAPSTLQNGRSDSLSTKLNQSNGVIRPRGDIDPGMKMPAPADGATTTPVVPPSATGGENAK